MKKEINYPPGKGQVLYSKSKVYLHITSSKKDNIPGYLVIVRPFADSKDEDLVVAFIPETDLSSEDKATLDYFDLYGLDGENENFYSSEANDNQHVKRTHLPKCIKFIDRPSMSSISSYAFGVTIGQLYTVQVRPKTSSLWEGSIILHPRFETDRLPAIFFHDDESPGTKREQKLKNQSFSPYAENKIGGNLLYWGGDRFVSCLKNYAKLTESTLESGMFLVNCTQEDAIGFVPDVTQSEVEDYDLSADFNRALNTAKWKVLTGLASISNFAKKQINSAIESNILPKSIQKLIERPEVKKITDDFDSANVYLAKWALSVQEEAEKNRRMIIGNQYYKDLIRSELGDGFVELTPQEVANATRKKKLTKDEWNSFFDSSGSLQFTIDEVLEKIFHCGLEDDVRKEAWLFILGVYPWASTFDERDQLTKTLENNYCEYKNEWVADFENKSNDEYWKDQRLRIYKDLKRTDRDIDIYAATTDEEQADANDFDNCEENDALFNNPNLLILRDILFSYNEINKNLGYVQGMCDLLSPLYYVFRDESLTFWAFVRFMERMERNFVRDLSGMKEQMLTLTELVQFMLPDLYVHLEKYDATNLFFFFRMLLVWLKRELSFFETMDLWEVMWTDYYSSQFILFFGLAILQKHSKIMIQTLRGFDGILRYINDLSGNLDLQELLTRSELLFVKFKQMVALIDRSNSGIGAHALRNKPANTLVVSDNLRKLLSREIVIVKEEPRTAETAFG